MIVNSSRRRRAPPSSIGLALLRDPSGAPVVYSTQVAQGATILAAAASAASAPPGANDAGECEWGPVFDARGGYAVYGPDAGKDCYGQPWPPAPSMTAAQANALMNARIAATPRPLPVVAKSVLPVPIVAQQQAETASAAASLAAARAADLARVAVAAKGMATTKGTDDARAACLAAAKVASDAQALAAKLAAEADAKAAAAAFSLQPKAQSTAPAGDGGMYAVPGELYAFSPPEEAVTAKSDTPNLSSTTDKITLGVQIVGGLFLLAQIAKFFMPQRST